MATTASFTQLYGRRFSEEEQLAFGRFSHLNVRANFAEIAGQSLGLRANGSKAPLLRSRPPSGQQEMKNMGRRASSAPSLGVMSAEEDQHQSWPTSQSSSVPMTPKTSLDSSPRRPQQETKTSLDQTQLRSVIARLLPAEDLPSCKKTKQERQQVSTALQLDTLALALPNSTAVTPVSRSRSDSIPAAVSNDRSEDAQLPRKMRLSRSMRQRMQVLERFRFQLLQRFRSLFDAFTRLHDLATRENALTLEDFCQAFSQIGVKEADAMEVFAAMDCKGKQLVSLADLRTALVTGSKQALLWELRCRLLTQGITPSDFSKVRKILSIARRPRHRTVRQRRRPLPHAWAGFNPANVEEEEEMPDTNIEVTEAEDTTKVETTYAWAENLEVRTGFLPSSTRLSRTDWLQVCAAIALTLIEAERLYEILVNDETRMVDLQDMFTILRSGVAPHVSLERFATRVLTRYGSLQAAFHAVCNAGTTTAEDEKAAATAGVTTFMRWPMFHSLAVTLDVSDTNAEGLWKTLTLAQRSQDGREGCLATHSNSVAFQEIQDESGAILEVPVGADTEGTVVIGPAKRDGEAGAITEATFVKELTVWAPATALGSLKNQVDEHFSDLSEFRYALGQTGMSLSAISPAELESALLAVGITGCNAERVYTAVQSAWRGGRKGSNISVDDVVEALRNNSGSNGSAARSAVRDDLRPLWQKLHTIQADLRTCPIEAATLDCSNQVQAGLKHIGGKPKCCSKSGMRSSASMPSLRGSGGPRSRLARHSRSRRGSTT